jgi:Type II secretion system (T2SS), protein G
MKQCGYCGAENEDDATHCFKCGQQDFPENAPPVIESMRPKAESKWVLRILAGLGVWLAVTGISLYVAWGNASNSKYTWFEQYITQRNLAIIAKAIPKYHDQFGVSPNSMGDLMKLTNSFPDGPEGGFPDGWGRPFIFSHNGTDVLVTSYGRDGKPGGKGLDCDLTSANWKPEDARPTFEQFLHGMRAGGMINSSIICGGLAFALTVFTIRIPDVNRERIVILAAKLFFTLVAASIVASFITALHIPSGH